MKIVTAKTDKICAFCKEMIKEGEECVQSESRYDLFYHKNCAKERYGNLIKS